MAANQNAVRRRGMAGWFNSKLTEEPGQLFKENKWRFWFIAQVILQILNTALTWYFFPGNLGGIIFGAGALLCWLFIAFMHYTDSGDKMIDHGVTILDSLGLLFAVAHFSILVWIVGHAAILEKSEVDYEGKRTEYNKQIESKNQLALEKAKIDAQRARDEVRRAALEEGAAYWAAQTGSVARTAKRAAKPGAATGTDEQLESLEKPTRPEGETAAEFKARHDATVRWLGAGELLLAAISLIYIRFFAVRANHRGQSPSPSWRRSSASSRGDLSRLTDHEVARLGDDEEMARRGYQRAQARMGPSNLRRWKDNGDGTQTLAYSTYPDDVIGTTRKGDDDDFPSLLDAEEAKTRSYRENLDTGSREHPNTGTSANGANTRQSGVSAVSGKNSATARQSGDLEPDDQRAGLRILREHLRAIAAHHPGVWFKADLMNGGVAIRLCRQRNGIEESTHTTHQSIRILRAALERKPKRFRRELVAELIHQGFPIQPESANVEGRERAVVSRPLKNGKDTSASADIR